jgi:uncharacterized alkaline shock family protein YloU
MHHKEESQADLGTINIHYNVIASVASIAATEIEGVKAIGKTFASWFLEHLGSHTSVIKVQIDNNEQVSLSIPLITVYGYNIPDVVSKVQENVRHAVEKTTNLTVKDICVSVQGIEK